MHPAVSEMHDVADDGMQRRTAAEAPRRDDEIVFVSIVQFAEKPKGAEPTAIPSVVRLTPLYACEVAQSDHLAKTNTLGAGESLAVLAALRRARAVKVDGERRSCLLAEAPSTVRVAANDQLTEEVVEAGSQVVGDLADPYPPLRRCLDAVGEVELIHSCLSVVCTNAGSPYLTTKEPLTLKLKQGDLLLCLCDLGSWPIQGVHEEISNQDGTHRQCVA